VPVGVAVDAMVDSVSCLSSVGLCDVDGRAGSRRAMAVARSDDAETPFNGWW
jgi:hypothetical protein